MSPSSPTGAVVYARSKPKVKKELPGEFASFEFLDPARMRIYTWIGAEWEVSVAPGVVTVYDHAGKKVQDVNLDDWGGDSTIKDDLPFAPARDCGHRP